MPSIRNYTIRDISLLYKAKKVALVFEQKPTQVWFFDLRKVEDAKDPMDAVITSGKPEVRETPKLEDPDAYDEKTASALDHLTLLSK